MNRWQSQWGSGFSLGPEVKVQAGVRPLLTCKFTTGSHFFLYPQCSAGTQLVLNLCLLSNDYTNGCMDRLMDRWMGQAMARVSSSLSGWENSSLHHSPGPHCGKLIGS